jgi:hypothetical protein
MKLTLDIDKQDFVALCASNPEIAGQVYDTLDYFHKTGAPNHIDYDLLKRICGEAVKTAYPEKAYKYTQKIPAIRLVRSIVYAYDRNHPLGTLTDAKQFVEDLV